MTGPASPERPTGSAAPGWHPDPSGRHDFRWFNGRVWTADIADDGRRGFDPSLDPEPRQTSGPGRAAALTSATLAVIAICISWMPFVVVLGVAAAMSAIVLGIVAVGRAAPGVGNTRSLAIGGIVCGVAALGVSGIGMSSSRSLLDDVRGTRDPGAHEVQVVSCVVDTQGRAVANGTISNNASGPRRYVVTVTFTDAVREFADRSARVPVVDPGESAHFEVTTSAGGTPTADLECRIADVSSPIGVFSGG